MKSYQTSTSTAEPSSYGKSSWEKRGRRIWMPPTDCSELWMEWVVITSTRSFITAWGIWSHKYSFLAKLNLIPERRKKPLSLEEKADRVGRGSSSGNRPSPWIAEVGHRTGAGRKWSNLFKYERNYLLVSFRQIAFRIVLERGLISRSEAEEGVGLLQGEGLCEQIDSAHLAAERTIRTPIWVAADCTAIPWFRVIHWPKKSFLSGLSALGTDTRHYTDTAVSVSVSESVQNAKPWFFIAEKVA